MRVALIFFETHRRMSWSLPMTIGKPIASESLRQMERSTIARFLRRETMALAGPETGDLDEVFVWPSHVRW